MPDSRARDCSATVRAPLFTGKIFQHLWQTERQLPVFGLTVNVTVREEQNIFHLPLENRNYHQLVRHGISGNS